jgi:predicted transposase/invertase (TIGR01784 family)
MARKGDTVKDFFDRSYKKIFSNKGFIKYLLQGFVKLKWVDLIDFERITLEPVSFIDRLFRKKEADIIWKLPLKNGSEAYLYLLLEFQSGVDYNMALRFASYILNFYATELKKKKRDKLPVVFPLLLYNGKQRWTAAQRLQDMIDVVDPSLREYLLRFTYFTIDIGRFSKRSLVKLKNNLVTAIFLLENARNEKELKKVLEEMVEIVKKEADKDLVDSFTDWLEMQLKREKIENINISKIISEKGEHNMLSETLHEILKEREEKGIKKGKKEGIKGGLLKTATELLKEGLGEDFIRRVTGLPLKEIKRLKNELGL